MLTFGVHYVYSSLLSYLKYLLHNIYSNVDFAGDINDKASNLGYLMNMGSIVVLELLHTHLGFFFPKVFPCLLVIISHYPISYILGENIPPGEYSLSVHTSV
jgi:hypothetical protein